MAVANSASLLARGAGVAIKEAPSVAPTFRKLRRSGCRELGRLFPPDGFCCPAFLSVLPLFTSLAFSVIDHAPRIRPTPAVTSKASSLRLGAKQNGDGFDQPERFHHCLCAGFVFSGLTQNQRHRATEERPRKPGTSLSCSVTPCLSSVRPAEWCG
jgi:hypothetical protein